MMDKGTRVLLVEKNNAVCHCIENILKKNVYDVDLAHNARDALTKIQNNIVDLVLFDCGSLGMNISEFVSLIKNSVSNVPSIVAMVDSMDESSDHDYTQLSVDDLIIKPVNSSEIQYRIHRVLDQRNRIRVFNKDRADLETLLEVSRAVSSTMNSKEILHTIVKKVAALIDVTRCSIFRVIRTEKFAQVIASHDDPNIHLEIMLDNYPEVKKALETGETVIVRHILHDPLMKDVQENVKLLKGNAIVVVPIILKDDVIGILFLRSIREDTFFHERELKFLKMIASITADVLDRAFLCENLDSARLQLIQSERLSALCELATGAVHNFNNLLSGILGHTQMLLSKDIDAAICERLQIIEKLVLDGSAVVRRVREFKGICTLTDFTTININDIVNDVVRMTESKWSGGPNYPGITLRIDTDSTDTPVIEGNASELREVFINILFNAVDAMPDGGELTIQTRTNEKDVFVCFFDTGKGMSKETKKRVFDPFFTTKGSKGMGLGMSIAHGIINRHNGQIIIDSKLGAGTAVTVRFPVSRKFIGEMPTKSHLKQIGKTTTLLIEDREVASDALVENLIN